MKKSVFGDSRNWFCRTPYKPNPLSVSWSVADHHATTTAAPPPPPPSPWTATITVRLTRYKHHPYPDLQGVGCSLFESEIRISGWQREGRPRGVRAAANSMTMWGLARKTGTCSNPLQHFLVLLRHQVHTRTGFHVQSCIASFTISKDHQQTQNVGSNLPEYAACRSNLATNFE